MVTYKALPLFQVGARLISHAGSLTNLAKYPASTVQILGAEKALFRLVAVNSFGVFGFLNRVERGENDVLSVFYNRDL